MRTTAFSLLAVLMAAPAFAGGVAPPPPPPVIVPVAEDDWSEFYIGLQGELVEGEADTVDFDGNLLGVFAGYRYDLGSVTVGAEIDYMHGNFNFGSIPFGAAVVELDYDAVLLRVGGEVGYDLGNALPYATAGFAQLDLELGALSASDDGYFYGLGLDVRASDRIVIGAEVLQHEFDDFNGGADLSFTTFGVNVAFTF